MGIYDKKASIIFLCGLFSVFLTASVSGQNMFRKMMDFDGDGKGDLTVFRQSDGTWWWMRNSDNVVSATTFGASGDIPVPADYDGDGKTDIAIWRRGAQSYYWVYGSQVGVYVIAWGVAIDSIVRF